MTHGFIDHPAVRESAEGAVLRDILDDNWDAARDRLRTFLPGELAELHKAAGTLKYLIGLVAREGRRNREEENHG